MKKYLCLLLLFLLCSWPPALSTQHLLAKKEAKQKTEDKKEEPKKVEINENEFEPVLIGALLEKPFDYVSKKIKFRGKFSSFTTLALDYPPALRKSKDYISICIFRTDSMIPLSELKLAYPVKDAKENPVIRDLEEGDLLEIYGDVFSAALDEPWVDIAHIKKLESALKKGEDKLVQEKTENKEVKEKANSEKKKKKDLK